MPLYDLWQVSERRFILEANALKLMKINLKVEILLRNLRAVFKKNQPNALTFGFFAGAVAGCLQLYYFNLL